MKSLVVLFAAVAAVPSFAGEFEEPPTPLDTLVVTATRSEQWQSEANASVEVITRAQIERAHATDLGGLLRGIAGLDVARNGGPGSPASVFIRGMESNHTLFLVDGVRYTTESFLNAQIQNLAPEMIERIEVVKGPRSGLWGSDAMGGVVHIITRRPGDGLGGTASLRAGSYGAREAGAYLGFRDAATEAGLSLQYQQFAGFPPMRSGGDDRGHENLNARVQGALALGDVRLSARHLEATGMNEYVFFGTPRSQDFTNRISAVDAAVAVTGGWHTRTTVSLAHDLLDQREPSDPARPQLLDYTEVRRRTAEWDNRFTLGGLAIGAGLTSSRSDIDSGFYSEFGDSFVRDYSEQHAVFGSAEASFGRFDAQAAARHARHNRFGGHTTGDLALGWRFGPTRVGVAGGSAYKEPELTDLYGDFGNPDLEPERSASIEANLRHAIGRTQALSVAVFQTIASNLVVFDNATLQPENVERARIRGLEAGWRYDDGTWHARLSGSMQNPVNETTQTRLLRRSRRSAQAELGRTLGPWSGQIELLAHGDRIDVGDERLGGYVLLNAGASHQFGPRWRLSLRGENLLDKDYELIDGFRTPGRSGSLELRASF